MFYLQPKPRSYIPYVKSNALQFSFIPHFFTVIHSSALMREIVVKAMYTEITHTP